MLSLSRNIGEILLIGDSIEIFVVDVRGGQVRLAIKAPRHIAISRKESAGRRRGTPKQRSAEPRSTLP